MADSRGIAVGNLARRLGGLELRKDFGREDHGMAGAVTIARHDDALVSPPGAIGPHQEGNDGASEERMIDGVEKKGRARPCSAEAREQGAELTGAPAAIHDNDGAAGYVTPHTRGVAAEDDDGAFEVNAIGKGNIERSAPAEAGERPGKAEPCGAARGKDDGDNWFQFHRRMQRSTIREGVRIC